MFVHMTKLTLLLILFLLSSTVYAQIDADSATKTGAVCGNKIREPLEPCDKTSTASDNDLCPAIGKVLKIAMICYPEECTCLPRKYIVCGDKHTKGNEICDPPDADYCPEVGKILGTKVECNTKTCLCKATASTLPEAPKTSNQTNLTQALCGNRQIDENEQCDPPGRMCTSESEVGICSETCTCEEVKDETNTKDNSTQETQNSEQNATTNTTIAEEQKNEDPAKEQKTSNIETETNSGISDTTYTVLLIILIVIFIVAMGIGSYFIYKRSQIGDLDEQDNKPPTAQ